MVSYTKCLPGFLAFCAIIGFGTNAAVAQNPLSEFQKTLSESAAFNQSDFVAVGRGETVVRLLPVKDKKEVAVCGLVSLQTPAEAFLQSFRDSMTRKSNSAILEIGRFGETPTLADLHGLTFEDRDLDDLKECVVGDCKLKLSAGMIQRLHAEVDWEASDYRIQATRLLKMMLLEYVRDYLERGNAALIHYHDKPEEVWLADEQRALMSASWSPGNVLTDFPRQPAGLANSDLTLVENAIVWSKIKFGLKPVIAFNHITVYRRKQVSGPQVLVMSKQIYANHYFDSSLALTALVKIPGASQASYLFYENHSRADGLGGAFGKLKRGIVEDKAVSGLRTILESSRANFSATSVGTDAAVAVNEGISWRRFKVGKAALALVLVAAFVALFALSNSSWRAVISGAARH